MLKKNSIVLKFNIYKCISVYWRKQVIKLKDVLEEKVDISDISWNHQKLLKVGGDYIHKSRDGRLWYEIENDIKKSKNRTLIKYFKEYEKARLKLSQAGAMLTRAFNLEKK